MNYEFPIGDWSQRGRVSRHSSFILSKARGVAGERESGGEALAGRCCRAALKFGPRDNAALPLLESLLEGSAELKEPETKEREFEDVMKSAEQAAVLALVH